LVPIRGRPTGRELLKIQLWDWDMGKTDDFVGLVQVGTLGHEMVFLRLVSIAVLDLNL
jgi:hypothetical protein